MANEILTEEEKAKIKNLETFLKESWCIDGRCDFIEMVEVKNNLLPLNNVSYMKRGFARMFQVSTNLSSHVLYTVLYPVFLLCVLISKIINSFV